MFEEDFNNDPSIDDTLASLDPFHDLEEWQIIFDKREKINRSERDADIVRQIDHNLNEILDRSLDVNNRIDDELRNAIVRIILAGDTRREIFDKHRVKKGKKLDLYTRSEIKILTYEIWETDNRHRNHLRKSGENYARTHLFSAVLNGIVDGGTTSLETIIALLRHDDLEDHKKIDIEHREDVVLLRDDLWNNYLDDADFPANHRSKGRKISAMKKRVTALVEAVSNIKDEEKSKEENEEANFRRFLLAIKKYGQRPLRIRIYDRTHNIESIATQKPDRIDPIIGRTLNVHTRLTAKLEMADSTEHLVTGAYAFKDPQLLVDFRAKKRAAFEKFYKARGDRERRTILHTLLGPLQSDSRIQCIAIKDLKFSDYVRGSNGRDDIDNIKTWDPMSELVVLVKDDKDIEDVKYEVEQSLDIGHNSTVTRKFRNPRKGFKFSVGNPEIGFSINIRINAEAKENLLVRGILPPDGDESDQRDLYAAVEEILERTPDSGQGVFAWTERFVRTANTIIVYTPENKPIELPEGATPIDFAAAVHSRVLANLKGVRVRARMDPDLGEEAISPFRELVHDQVVRIVTAVEDADSDVYQTDPSFYEGAGASASQILRNILKTEGDEKVKKYFSDICKLLNLSSVENDPLTTIRTLFLCLDDNTRRLLSRFDDSNLNFQKFLIEKRRNKEVKKGILRTSGMPNAARKFFAKFKELILNIKLGKLDLLRVISEKLNLESGEKIEVMFELPDKMGIAQELFAALSRGGLNISHIQQIQARGSPKAYMNLSVQINDPKKTTIYDLLFTLFKINVRFPTTIHSEKLRVLVPNFPYVLPHSVKETREPPNTETPKTNEAP